jgi:succinate-semialdehyde dehydrogenase / glutarate-semialdehyde dehydrogenase
MNAEFAVVDPATGETLRRYPTITDEELHSALARADRAHGPWSRETVEARAELVRRIGDLHGERQEELARIIGREMGKPITQALGEVDYAARIYRFYADQAESLMADEPIELLGGVGSALIRRSSLGTLLGIMPWNFPYYQVARFAGANLILGNTILLKHAQQCPESAAAVAAIFVEGGAPEGVYENVYASHDQIEWLIADRRVRGVSLTGSERAGAAVAEIAGRNLKKVVLELGGSDPFILLSTTDLAAEVAAAIRVRMGNAGQACNAGKRFIVIDDLYDEFLAAYTQAVAAIRPSDPADADTALGPLSSTAAAEQLEDQVRRAVGGGAELLLGGERDGNFFEPTILAGVGRDSEAAQEEFFGPVAQVYRVGSEDDAIELANSTTFGLGAYVRTTDPDQAQRVADRLDVGMVYVNLVGASGPELPFGGVKNSGFGRELGRLGAEEFVNKKMIRIRP